MTYNVIDIPSATEATSISATDGADEFRYEFNVSSGNGLSSEGNVEITINNFDSANDKIVFVNVGGNDLTIDEFKALGGLEISGNSFDNVTGFYFAPDSAGASGTLNVEGVYDADLTTITVEILSDTNLSASSSGDLG